MRLKTAHKRKARRMKRDTPASVIFNRMGRALRNVANGARVMTYGVKGLFKAFYLMQV